MAQTCPLIAPVQTILHRVPCSNETLPNAPKHYEMLQNMSFDQVGWIECVLCEKFRCDFMAQTCALIALVQPILHRVSCSNETLTNAPKHYEMHRNMSLGSNGVDWVHWLRKIATQLRGTNFCTSSARFASSFVSQLNGPKCTKILWNAPKHFFRVQWGGSGAFVAKNSDATSWHELLP